MALSRYIPLVLLGLTAGCAWHPPASAPPSVADAPNEFGVLLMAHGGSPDWNAAVMAAVQPLRSQHTIEVAFGMADAASIQAAVRALEVRGVRRIGVVRLFISGDSWYDRTEQILGLRPGAPPMVAATGHAHEATSGGQAHGMEFWQIQTEASYALSRHGLAEAEGMGTVLADRARALSRSPHTEDVLILAHGPGDDAENERWIAYIETRAKEVRDALPFRRVQVMTLREDWPEQREEAERRIRSFVSGARDDGITTIVIPFRVQGFGPYAKVLGGLDYVSAGLGLIPHTNVTRWIAEEINALRRGPFRFPNCATGSPNRPMQRTAACAGRR